MKISFYKQHALKILDVIHYDIIKDGQNIYLIFYSLSFLCVWVGVCVCVCVFFFLWYSPFINFIFASIFWW